MDKICFYVGRPLRKKFRQKCLKNKTTMVGEIRKFMEEYIKEK